MKLLLAGLFSAILFVLPQASPVNKQDVHRASAPIATVVAKPSTAQKAVQPQPEIKTAAQVVTPVQPPQIVQGCDSYRNIFSQYDWDVSDAVAICKAESGGDTTALSQTCDRGLMQVNCIHADMVNGDLSELYDPATNISVAHKIYSAHGWEAWSTYNSGAFLRFL